MAQISSFRDVVALWPSPAVMASDIGAGVAAVRKWPQRDVIPAEWWVPILQTDVARRSGITAELLATLAAREPVELRA